jgi:hypothetical protein
MDEACYSVADKVQAACAEGGHMGFSSGCQHRMVQPDRPGGWPLLLPQGVMSRLGQGLMPPLRHDRMA